MMRELARCCRKEVDGQSKVKVKALSWGERVKLGHLPFRRDCRVCQEASARGRPHRRVRHPGWERVVGTDVDGVQDKRYLLVAAYTWPQIDTSEGEELPCDEPGGEEEGGRLEEGLLPEEDPGEEAAEEGFEVGGAAEEQEQPILPEPQKEPHPLKTLYMTVPLRSKDRKEVLAKSMMRRVLIATKWDPVWWPCVARYVSEVRIGYDLKGHKPKYQFGEDVVVPKRAWKQKSFRTRGANILRRSTTSRMGMRCC